MVKYRSGGISAAACGTYHAIYVGATVFIVASNATMVYFSPFQLNHGTEETLSR